MKIAIDAGHGLYTAGKRTPDGIHEWELNNAVANYITEYLNGYATIIRTDDTTGQTDIPLTTRRNKAVNNADLLISIHHNALDDDKFSTATGVETYTNTQYGTTQAKELAALLVNQISYNTGLRNRGAKQAMFTVIATSKIPAILCEGGFMDGKIDSYYIRKEGGQRAYAKAVADVVIKYYGLKKNGGDTPKPEPTPQPKEPDCTGTITYQAYDGKWEKEVNKCDNTPEGYAGDSINYISGFRAKPQYGELIYEGHELGGQWLGEVNSKDYKTNDTMDGNSYAGIYEKPMDKIRIKSTRGWVRYRVLVKINNKLIWLDWVTKFGDADDEYAGITGVPILGIQME